ncbi:MAG: hypothetical protein ACKESB_03785, partial [Candidatus Hodgkinia cicadicola]
GEKEWFPFFLSFSGLVVFSNSGCHRFAAAAAPSFQVLTACRWGVKPLFRFQRFLRLIKY